MAYYYNPEHGFAFGQFELKIKKMLGSELSEDYLEKAAKILWDQGISNPTRAITIISEVPDGSLDFSFLKNQVLAEDVVGRRNFEMRQFLDRIDRVLRKASQGPINADRAVSEYVTPQRIRSDFADVLGPQKGEINSAMQKVLVDVEKQRRVERQKELAKIIKANRENRSFGPLDRDLLDAIDELMRATQTGDVAAAQTAEKIIDESVNDSRFFGIGLVEADQMKQDAADAVEFARQREADMLEKLFPEMGKTSREELVRQNPHLTKDLNMPKLAGAGEADFMWGHQFPAESARWTDAQKSMRELARIVSSLPPDQPIIVFHGTSTETGDLMTKGPGLDISKKPMGRVRKLFESGQKAVAPTYGDAPGRGLYVTLDPMIAQRAAYWADGPGIFNAGKIVAIRVKVGDISFPPEAYLGDEWLDYYDYFGFPRGQFPAEAPRTAWLHDIGGMIKPTRYLSPDEIVDVTDLVKSVSYDRTPGGTVRSLTNPGGRDEAAEWFRNSLLDRFEGKWGDQDAKFFSHMATQSAFPEIPASQRGLPAPVAAAEDVGVVIPQTTEAASKAGKLESIASMLRGEGRFGKVGKVLGKVGRGTMIAGDIGLGIEAIKWGDKYLPSTVPGDVVNGRLQVTQKPGAILDYLKSPPPSGVGQQVDPKSPAFQGGGGGGLQFQ